MFLIALFCLTHKNMISIHVSANVNVFPSRVESWHCQLLFQSLWCSVLNLCDSIYKYREHKQMLAYKFLGHVSFAVSKHASL